MRFTKLRILGSGFTEEEYDLYQFAKLENPDDASRFLSNRLNNAVFRPRVNSSAQKHLLEDKWVAQLYFASLGLPVPETYGVLHPRFGMTATGKPLRSADDFLELFPGDPPGRLVFKPRGGRQGRNIIIAGLARGPDGRVDVTAAGKTAPLGEFIASLPADAFNDYDGGYHGWLVQRYVEQHPFMLEINPHTVNTFRVITFIDPAGACKIHFAVLRLGRKGSTADNWDKGGLSVFIDTGTGRLGRGVFKPTYGGAWTSRHPDTHAELEGRVVPDWQSVIDVCRRAALSISGVRSIGWDIAFTPHGPVILEGNAEWSLPLAQVHSSGYLTDAVRADLAQLGAVFPTRLRSTAGAFLFLAARQWRRSKGPRLVARLLPARARPRHE